MLKYVLLYLVVVTYVSCDDDIDKEPTKEVSFDC